MKMRQALLVLGFALATPSVFSQQRVPLDDLGAARYLSEFQGGLYENGTNAIPADHLAAGMIRAAQIQPLDAAGRPSSSGRIALISIGMSNTTQEFCAQGNPAPCTSWSFAGQAGADNAVNRATLVLVNGARGGQTGDTWDSPTDSNYELVRTMDLAPAGLTEAQVQIGWVKVANPGPTISLPNANSDSYRLLTQMGNIARAMKVRYPNLKIVYLSSRIYAGYASTTLNPEPYAYESGFAVKWLIQAQIDQVRNAGAVINARAGDLQHETVAPWLAWGPYLWADGLNPRSDGLTWLRADLEGDGTHPSQSGEQKVGSLLLTFLKNAPTARSWFLAAPPSAPRRRAVR